MTDLAAVQQLLAHGRLSIDRCERGRTAFLSHLGAAPKLVPGAWLGHRDLLYALALANLSPSQRTSLARAVLVDHGREFGVGRLSLMTCPSGLPLGGSSLQLRPRGGGPTCLYTWALGPGAGALACDWLLLRALPAWALDAPPAPLAHAGLATLAALGMHVEILVATATCARQIQDHALGDLPFTAHPRFAPHLDGAARPVGEGRPEPAAIRLSPHDAFDPRTFGQVAKNRSQEPAGPMALVLVDAPPAVHAAVDTWLAGQPARRKVEVVAASCPGRLGRDALAELWRSAGRPQVLLRGDPAWTAPALPWLQGLGATVAAQHDDGTQLGLFA
ncbi:hypothetical protein [Nannocystis sp. SCPEA4]|uniref:hypothetical protein n=1 Tax=Nannocystis sp. SCPEA4 TaxID=2996787 RepID=UPI002270C472|nr:hypothetical protein [Nannocystis sp. SCPEA4]MCY1057988.1 hypothetical protein [Nannocystis sp. SCPEA4]